MIDCLLIMGFRVLINLMVIMEHHWKQKNQEPAHHAFVVLMLLVFAIVVVRVS